MNKGDVVSSIANKAGFTLKDADEAYKAFVETVAEALKKGEDVALAGFGTFKVKNKAARQGINPQTKETITKAINELFDNKLNNSLTNRNMLKDITIVVNGKAILSYNFIIVNLCF